MSAPSTTRGWCGRCGGYRQFLQQPFRCLSCGTYPSHRHTPREEAEREGPASGRPADALASHRKQAAT
jgi:hypothetical protein